jgi:hypothetical protein
VDSVHDALATFTLIDPATPILLTYSRSDALETLAAMVPGGSLLRSN